MKLIFISDIHGSARAMNFMEKVFGELKPDYIVILGDELYHGPRNPLPNGYDPKETARILNKYSTKIIAVRGNCDAQVDQMMLDYPIMADYSQIVMKERKIFLTHGHIYNPENMPKLNKGDIFVSGHTHIPVLEEKNGIYIINPGSISLPKGDNLPSYAIYEQNEINLYEINAYNSTCKKNSIIVK